MELTPDELKMVRHAVRNSIELREHHLATVQVMHDAKMKRKQARLRKELVPLRTALVKLIAENQPVTDEPQVAPKRH